VQVNTDQQGPADDSSSFPLSESPVFFTLDGPVAMALNAAVPMDPPFLGQSMAPTAIMGSIEGPPPPLFASDSDVGTAAAAAAAPPLGHPPGGDPGPGLLASTGHLSGPAPASEFTKRNWPPPAKIIEELQDLILLLDANGRIRYASDRAESLTGHGPAELRGLSIRDLVHPDDLGVFLADMNETIASGAPLRVIFRMRRPDGSYAILEATGHAHIADAGFAPNPVNQTPFCQAVFLSCRPYPTTSAVMLDSFLEHKIENERLRRRIDELRGETQDEADESERVWQQQQQQQQQAQGYGTAPSNSGRARRDSAAAVSPLMTGPGAAYTDAIELFTGLRYHEGERSRGITTGNPNATLIMGDASLPIVQERDARAGEKKKKLKMAEEHVCTDCGEFAFPGPKCFILCTGFLTHFSYIPLRHIGVSRMAQGTERAQDALQRMRTEVGQEGKEEEHRPRPFRGNGLDNVCHRHWLVSQMFVTDTGWLWQRSILGYNIRGHGAGRICMTRPLVETASCMVTH
jgi:PAS domain S-box-containing protein